MAIRDAVTDKMVKAGRAAAHKHGAGAMREIYTAMMLAAPAPRPRAIETERDPDYLAMIRTLPCLKCGMEPSEAAHVRFACAAFGKASGLSKKPEDRHAVPLCSGCHRLDRDAQHSRGEKLFWIQLGINPLITAEKLYAQRGDVVAMQAVIFLAIAERGRS